MRLNICALGVLLIMSLAACATLGFRSEAQLAFEQGLASFNRGQYTNAVPHFQKATELDPDFGKAYLYLGRSYLNLGQWVNAITALRTAFHLAPQESKQELSQLLFDGLIGGATAALKSGNFREAVGFFKDALAVSPQSTEAQQQLIGALVGLGGQLLAQGKPGEAITTFSEATQQAPQNWEAYAGLARAFWQHGDIFKALAAAQTAMGLAPNHQDVRSLLQQLQGR